jgi:hypothetical protein
MRYAHHVQRVLPFRRAEEIPILPESTRKEVREVLAAMLIETVRQERKTGGEEHDRED